MSSLLNAQQGNAAGAKEPGHQCVRCNRRARKCPESGSTRPGVGQAKPIRYQIPAFNPPRIRGEQDRGEPSRYAAPSLASLRTRLDNFHFDAAAFGNHQPLRRIAAYLDEHPGDCPNSRQAATIAGQEEHYFSQYFREKVGVTFGKWNSYRRVIHALELLTAADEESLTSIAENSGFPDLRALERHCHDWTGTTPRAIRYLLRRLSGRNSSDQNIIFDANLTP